MYPYNVHITYFYFTFISYLYSYLCVSQIDMLQTILRSIIYLAKGQSIIILNVLQIDTQIKLTLTFSVLVNSIKIKIKICMIVLNNRKVHFICYWS